MKYSKRWLEGAASLCDEIGAEDGVDPRRLSRVSEGERKRYKSRQLCKAAKQTLSLVMGGALSDPILQGLEVDEVTSSEDGQSLVIAIRCDEVGCTVRGGSILERLYAVQGFLRAEIARSVKRKRVPALRFKAVPASNEVDRDARQ